jgi:hypothetical protein
MLQCLAKGTEELKTNSVIRVYACKKDENIPVKVPWDFCINDSWLQQKRKEPLDTSTHQRGFDFLDDWMKMGNPSGWPSAPISRLSASAPVSRDKENLNVEEADDELEYVTLEKGAEEIKTYSREQSVTQQDTMDQV